MSGVLVCTLLAALAGQAPAPDRTFTVVSAEGTPVNGAAVLSGERKVIVYVAPGEPSARVIGSLRKLWDGAGALSDKWAARLVVVVAAPVNDAGVWLRERWGQGPLPRWYADPKAAGWRALGFDGTLGVAGFANGIVEWKLDGVINDPAVLEPAMRAWIEGVEP
jgi:hypothetical protein